jgi:hypothetical protein
MKDAAQELVVKSLGAGGFQFGTLLAIEPRIKLLNLQSKLLPNRQAVT